MLKALKGYVSRAACDPYGCLLLCVAMETMDDTVLLRKNVLTEMLAQLPELACHAHGSLPLLAVLAPRAKRYFTPEQVLQDKKRYSTVSPSTICGHLHSLITNYLISFHLSSSVTICGHLHS